MAKRKAEFVVLSRSMASALAKAEERTILRTMGGEAFEDTAQAERLIRLHGKLGYRYQVAALKSDEMGVNIQQTEKRSLLHLSEQQVSNEAALMAEDEADEEGAGDNGEA